MFKFGSIFLDVIKMFKRCINNPLPWVFQVTSFFQMFLNTWIISNSNAPGKKDLKLSYKMSKSML